MGCDYYIQKMLEIKYVGDVGDVGDVIVDYVKLYEIPCYFNYVGDGDSDGDSDSDVDAERIAMYLEVKYTPLVLFENKQWTNESMKRKYERHIKDIDLEKLISITKVEWRRLRQ
jgi:hypothetical protein